MSYKVLYRKYRPDNFSNLVGQENIIKILTNSILNSKISHAYIFSGPRGTGKTSSAKIFAKNVNCLDPVNGEACNVCQNCVDFSGASDIIELDAASNNSVDDIREIINNIKLAPNIMKYKVYIIDEVHMLSTSAFNALLLTLEDPPPHVIFILATTNIESVPITILSRCQRFDFKKITVDNIVDRIKYICKEENIYITDEAIIEIASLSDGGMRDSLSLLDQLSKENVPIDINLVLKFAGNISYREVNIIIDFLNQNNVNDLIIKFNELSSKSVDYKILIRYLIENISIKVRNILVNSEETRLSIKDYKSLSYDLTDCLNKINVNVDVYTLVLITLLSYMDVSINSIKDDVNKNVAVETVADKKTEENKFDVEEKIEKNLNKLKNAEIRVNNCFVEVNKEEKLKHKKSWKTLVESLDNKLKGYLIDTEVVMASPNIVTISCDNTNKLEDIFEYFQEIEDEYAKALNQDIKLTFITSDDWKNYSDKYIINIKNGVKYEFLEEIEDTEDLLSIVDEIFETEKIEER